MYYKHSTSRAHGPLSTFNNGWLLNYLAKGFVNLHSNLVIYRKLALQLDELTWQLANFQARKIKAMQCNSSAVRKIAPKPEKICMAEEMRSYEFWEEAYKRSSLMIAQF